MVPTRSYLHLTRDHAFRSCIYKCHCWSVVRVQSSSASRVLAERAEWWLRWMSPTGTIYMCVITGDSWLHGQGDRKHAERAFPQSWNERMYRRHKRCSVMAQRHLVVQEGMRVHRVAQIPDGTWGSNKPARNTQVNELIINVKGCSKQLSECIEYSLFVWLSLFN